MTTVIADDTARLARILADEVAPRWLRELHSYLAVKSQFVLYGNVRDRVAIPVGPNAYDLRTVTEAIVDTLALRGYEHVCTINPVHGVTLLTPTDVADEEAHLRATILWAEAPRPRFDPRVFPRGELGSHARGRTVPGCSGVR
jgi:hypothetical protein